MKNKLFLICILGLIALGVSACNGCNRTESDNDEALKEVNEKEVVDDYLKKEFETEKSVSGDASIDSLDKDRKEKAIKEISTSMYRAMTCDAILDSLENSIKLLETNGDLGVLAYFSELQSDTYFKACLKSEEGFKEKFNDLYRALGEIREKQENDL